MVKVDGSYMKLLIFQNVNFLEATYILFKLLFFSKFSIIPEVSPQNKVSKIYPFVCLLIHLDSRFLFSTVSPHMINTAYTALFKAQQIFYLLCFIDTIECLHQGGHPASKFLPVYNPVRQIWSNSIRFVKIKQTSNILLLLTSRLARNSHALSCPFI